MNNFLKKFNVFELILISFMATLGVAIKPIITPIVRIINAPLLIPGGAVAGGIYMLWIVLGATAIKKPFTGTMIAFVQSLMVIVTGATGSHGIMSILTYTIPGLAVDFAFCITGNKIDLNIKMFICGMLANASGTLLTSLMFFKLPLIPLALSVSAGALSGGLGGLIAYGIYTKLVKLNIFS